MSAGNVIAISGNAYAMRDGQKVELHQNDPIFQSDTLFTESGAKLEIKFNDDSLINLGPKTEAKVEDFVFNDESESFVLRLANGIMESASGKIVERNPDAFAIRTPLGTVGIRGTQTIHNVSSNGETHAIISISGNHTVVIQGQDGQSVVLSSNMQAVQLTDGFAPQMMILNPQVMEGLIQQITNNENFEEVAAVVTQVVSKEVEQNPHINVAIADSVVQIVSEVLGTTGKSVEISTEIKYEDLIVGLNDVGNTLMESNEHINSPIQIQIKSIPIIDNVNLGIISNEPRNYTYSSGNASFMGSRGLDSLTLNNTMNVYAELDGFHASFSNLANTYKVNLTSIENIFAAQNSNLYIGGAGLDNTFYVGQTFGSSIYNNFANVIANSNQIVNFGDLGGVFNANHDFYSANTNFNANYQSFGTYNLNYNTLYHAGDLSLNYANMGNYINQNIINYKGVTGLNTNTLDISAFTRISDDGFGTYFSAVVMNDDGNSFKIAEHYIDTPSILSNIDYYNFGTIVGSGSSAIWFGNKADTIDLSLTNNLKVNDTTFKNFTKLYGGDGNDTFNIASMSTSNKYAFHGENGNDTFNFANSSLTASGTGVLKFYGEDGNDTFNFSNVSINFSSTNEQFLIDGGTGNDIFNLTNLSVNTVNNNSGLAFTSNAGVNVYNLSGNFSISGNKGIALGSNSNNSIFNLSNLSLSGALANVDDALRFLGNGAAKIYIYGESGHNVSINSAYSTFNYDGMTFSYSGISEFYYNNVQQTIL